MSKIPSRQSPEKAGVGVRPKPVQGKTADSEPAISPKRQRIRPETRAEMLDRLTNPQISLHEAGIILRVCSATVRHYSDAGFLPHVRTPGGQRRFFLRDVMAFLRQREAEKRKR